MHLLWKLQSVALGLDQREICLPSVVVVVGGVNVVVAVVLEIKTFYSSINTRFTYMNIGS